MIELSDWRLWWLIVNIIVSIAVFAALTQLRGKFWQHSKFKSRHRKTQAVIRWVEEHWSAGLIFGIVLVFLYVTFVLVVTFGARSLFAAMVVAVLVAIFLFLILPRILRPHVHVTFLPCGDDNVYTRIKDLDGPITELKLAANTIKIPLTSQSYLIT